MGDPVVHFEIGGRDIDETTRFYSNLFDWDITVDGQGFGLVNTGSDVGIGGGTKPERGGVRCQSR